MIGSCAKQGYTPHLLVGDGSYQKGFLGKPGTNGMVGADSNTPFFDTSSPAIESMTKGLNQTNPSITKSSSYDDTAVWNWAIGNMLVEALKAGNLGASTPVTPAALRNALFTLHTTTAGGLITPITMTKGQPETNDCYYEIGHQEQQVHGPGRSEGDLCSVELSSRRVRASSLRTPALQVQRIGVRPGHDGPDGG